MISEIKPDILIHYAPDINNKNPISVVYVRPKTNQVNYERAIILATQKYADVIYLANLNGRLFLKNALIIEHYNSQYLYAIYAKKEMTKYPEMIQKFEEHFNTDFETANIIGSYEAILNFNMDAEDLFNYIVDDKDFLKLFGQTIKRINGYYVLNYDIPAILKKYTADTNIFVLAARFKDEQFLINELNQSIFENLNANIQTPIIDKDKLGMLDWSEQVRRTYHLSRNHLSSVFDMMDFIFINDSDHVQPENITFSHNLIYDGIISKKQLQIIKLHSLVYVTENAQSRLINILEESNGKSFEECIETLKNIDWKKTTDKTNAY